MNTLESLDPLFWIHLEVSTPLCEYTGESQLPAMNTRGIDFLVHLEQASKQVYKTPFWWQKDQGVKTPQVY
jgi:hypothetical protein